MAVTVALGIGMVPSPVAGQDGIVVEDDRLHPSLAGVQVSDAGQSGTVGAHRTAQGRLVAARQALDATTAALDGSASRRAQVEAELLAATAENERAAVDASGLRDRLRGLAVHSYMHGNPTAPDGLDLDRMEAELRQQTLVSTVSTRQQARLREVLAVVERTSRAIEEATTTLGELTAERSELEARRSVEATEVEAATAETDRTRRALADWRLGADVAGSDIPLVVLDAYVKAAERMAGERPECGLRWWGLAGIGKIETRHATYLGTRPGPDGVTLRPIIGIPLDGNNNTAVIPDSDGGWLDADLVWDRAVGPMQFIPGTWRTMGRDGSGDDRADPHNIYDAALSAAGLLCRSGGEGLDQEPGLRRAALGYNQSGTYADMVVRGAFEYAAQADRLIPPPPDLSWLQEVPPPAAVAEEPTAEPMPPPVVTPDPPPAG